MTDFELLRVDMDAQTENRLGDSIMYSIAGAEPVPIVGFLLREGGDESMSGLDPIPSRWFFKVAVDRLPGGPGRTDRLSHSRLPGTMRPAADSETNTGQSWIFELQKAP